MRLSVTHSDDIILSEAQFIIVMTFEIQQSLCSSPSVTRHHEKVFMVPLVALHGVIWSQILERKGQRVMGFLKQGTTITK